MLNIGGIANFTYLPSNLDATKVFSTDTGTGNTLMDQYIQAHYPGKYFDENAAIASMGNVNPALLSALLNHSFFEAGFPKTIGPELFNLEYLNLALEKSETTGISHEDTLATLNAFSAQAIANALNTTIQSQNDFSIYVSGGGMHNPLLLDNLKKLLPGYRWHHTGELGIHPDAKVAGLFAVLANECICGNHVGPGNPAEGIPKISMGKISFPS